MRKYKFIGSGLTTKEKHWAEDRYKEYSAHNHLEKIGELQLLEDLIFLECMEARLKAQLDELNKFPETRTEVPDHILKSLDENRKQRINLHDKLGLFRDTEDNSVVKEMQLREKKCEMWESENQASREMVCAWCGQMNILKIRTDKYTVGKHPFLKDKLLTNNYAWNLYQQDTITRLDLAKILLGEEVETDDYIEFLEKRMEPKKLAI